MPITTELYDYVSTTYTNVTFPLCIFTQQKSNVYVFVTPIDNYNAKACMANNCCRCDHIGIINVSSIIAIGDEQVKQKAWIQLGTSWWWSRISIHFIWSRKSKQILISKMLHSIIEIYIFIVIFNVIFTENINSLSNIQEILTRLRKQTNKKTFKSQIIDL